MHELFYFFIIIILFIYLTYQYYRTLYEGDKIRFKGEIIEVDSYFYSDGYLKASKNRKIWLHIPFEKNSRHWANFGSRTSTDLNLAYMTLCIKSIIDFCGESYDIFIIDDTNFSSLLHSDIDMLKLSGPLLEKYRELCLLQVLYEYGGVVVPPSLFLHKSIKHVDNPTKWYISEMSNQNNVSYNQTHPSLLLMGSNKHNSQLIQYINYYSENIKNDFGEESLHFSTNYMKQNKISYLDGQIIGIKDINNKPILLEDLMENKTIHLSPHNIGVYIPHAELIKRTKYNWFCALSAIEVLKCNIFISSYMRT